MDLVRTRAAAHNNNSYHVCGAPLLCSSTHAVTAACMAQGKADMHAGMQPAILTMCVVRPSFVAPVHPVRCVQG
jgi:hypothetical protein